MPSARRPLVIDTSTLIGVLTGKPGAYPARALNIAVLWYQLVLSDETLAELERVIHRAALDKYRPLVTRVDFLAKLRAAAVLHPVTQPVQACRDPNDDKFLALALSARAPAIVSSDPDLYLMNPFQTVEILTPRAFVERHAHLPTPLDGLSQALLG